MKRRYKGEFFLLPMCCFLILSSSFAFQSDELLQDDEEFGLEGRTRPDLEYLQPIRTPVLKRSDRYETPSSSDSKVQFTLEHAFGNSDFSPAGTFAARLKSLNHGGQTLTKLRFSRNDFTEEEKESFKKLLKDDEFYRIRVPSNVLSPPGKDYVISSVKARCLPRETLDEHFVIHMIGTRWYGTVDFASCPSCNAFFYYMFRKSLSMDPSHDNGSQPYTNFTSSHSSLDPDGVNIVAVNYGSAGSCQYPRVLKLPAKWSFNSHTVMKNSEQAPRTPSFSEETLLGEDGDGEGVKPEERSFWAKYWMYAIPLGLIVMNAITQAMNMPEEQAAGQPASQGGQPVGQRAPNPAVRRR